MNLHEPNLDKYGRHYLGEELELLGSKELDQLERQLDSSLKQVRSTKVVGEVVASSSIPDRLTRLQFQASANGCRKQISVECSIIDTYYAASSAWHYRFH